MRPVDRIHIRASLAIAFTVASDVSRWPTILPPYRWVRFLERRGSGGVVEMAAHRPFGLVADPTWWVSEMTVDGGRGEIRYRHIPGITTGMDVVWRVGPPRGREAGVVSHRGHGPGGRLDRAHSLPSP